MIHYSYIGFIDPRRPVDPSEKPCRISPTRPVPPELVARLADRFGVTMGEEVVDAGGYLISHLGFRHGGVHPFEAGLVAEGCIILTEMWQVIHPPEAVAAAYNESLSS